MNWTPILTELAKSIPVLLGGALAVAGAIVGQWLTHQYSAERERKKLVTEKAEQIINLLYDDTDWIQKKMRYYVFDASDPGDTAPLDKAYALQRLHFPELLASLQGISRAIVPINSYFALAIDARAKGEWQHDRNHYNPLFDAYLAALHAAVSAVVNASAKRNAGSESSNRLMF